MVTIAEIKETITLPDGVSATLTDATISITGENGTLTREFAHPKITVTVENNAVVVSCKNARRKQKALAGTFVAHLNNMVKGVTEGFTYTMKTVYSHFPIKTMVDGDHFVIENFLGERSPRKALILEGVTVEAKGDDVTVTGIDKEKVGQTVANIERATAVKRRDIRVFQDGVYRTSKGGC